MVLAEMVPMFNVRALDVPSVPTDISPSTVRAPALILPTMTPPLLINRLPVVAVVAPWTIADAMLVLATKASSLEEGSTPDDQLAGVNQLPLVPSQLFVSAQAESLWLARITTSATPAKRTRA